MRAGRARLGALLRPATVKYRLLRHLTAVLVLGAVGTAALLVSYDAVHRVPAELQARSVFAVQDAVAFRTALLDADAQVRRMHTRGLIDTAGPGERYEQQITAADQALSRLSDRQIDGDRGRRAVEVMNVLLGTYDRAIDEAAWHYQGAADRLMREQKLGEAAVVLGRDGTGILSRLAALQDDQLAHVRDQTDVSAAEKAGWIVAEAALLVLCVVLVLAWRLLWRRCGRLFSGWLAAALVLTGVLAVLPLEETDDTQDKLDTVHAALLRIDRTAGQREIAAGAELVSRTIASTSTATRALPLLTAGCGLAVVCAAGGLLRRLYADYGSDKP